MLPSENKYNQSWMIKAGFGVFIAFYLLSSFSKAAINFFFIGAYCLAIASISLNGRAFLQHKPLIRILFYPLGFGLVVSVFSETGGFVALGDYINFFKFYILPLSFAVLIRDKKGTQWLLVMAVISALIATIYGFYHAEQRVFAGFHGYFDWGRTPDMLMTITLACMVFIDDGAFRKRNPQLSIALAVLIPLFLFAIFMSSIRGTWVGLTVAVLGYALIFNRKWLIPLILIAAVMMLLPGNTAAILEVKSILDFETHISNNSRFHLWKTGLDFSLQNFWFGTGEQWIKQGFLDFFAAKPEGYQQIYHLAAQYPGNFHNSYLQIFIQWGMLTFAALVFGFSQFIRNLVGVLHSTTPEKAVHIRAFLIVTIGFLVSQFFHGDLYSYGSTIYFLFLYSTIQVASGSDDSDINLYSMR